jgi:hypothetical protein
MMTAERAQAVHGNHYERTEMTEEKDSSLDRAADMGPLPGVAAENAEAEKGEDHSRIPNDGEANGSVLGRVVRDLDND